MNKIHFLCICSEKYLLCSNFKKNININICQKCHPFYTKKKNFFDNSKRIKNFNNKYAIFFKK
ncbi:50S ribosomal protein L31 [Candidatus Carsonella ruddii]|uniref:50S ribosomal protein L31 n=1 Tax=Carsonella ruddii TaxID=114186 RepID=UPI003D9A3BB6